MKPLFVSLKKSALPFTPGLMIGVSSTAGGAPALPGDVLTALRTWHCERETQCHCWVKQRANLIGKHGSHRRQQPEAAIPAIGRSDGWQRQRMALCQGYSVELAAP